MSAPTSLRLRLAAVGLFGFLVACDPTGGTADAGTDLELADPAASTVTVTPTQVPADGLTPAVVTVTLKDAKNQVLADRAVKVVAADIQVQPDAQAKTDASGVARFELRSVVPGPKLLKVFVKPGTASEQLLFEASLSFSAIPAPYLAFERSPGDVVAGETMESVQVKFVGASGDTVAVATTVTLSLKNSDAELFGTTSIAAVDGVATFADLSVWKAGTGLILEASAQRATSNVSEAFDVTPAAATGFAFRGTVPNGTVRAPIAAPTGIELDLVDMYGNRGAIADRDVQVELRLGGGSAGAQLEGGEAQVIAAGEAVIGFKAVSIDAEGTGYALRIEESTPPATGALGAATSNTFDVVDDIAPAMPQALATGAATQTSIELTWTAPGDDELLGDISGYELRYATTMLVSEQDFLAATEVIPGPQTASVGTPQAFIITGLQPDTLYSFGLRAKDGASNGSMLALTSATTLPDGCAPVNPCDTPPAAPASGTPPSPTRRPRPARRRRSRRGSSARRTRRRRRSAKVRPRSVWTAPAWRRSARQTSTTALPAPWTPATR